VPTNARATAALLVIGAFLCGIVVGVAGDHTFLLFHGRLRPSHGASEAVANRIVARLDRELKLTPQQHTAVQQIIDKRRQRIEAIWTSVGPQVREEMDGTRAEIERLLTPEQREKFRQMHQHMQDRNHHPRMHPGF